MGDIMIQGDLNAYTNTLPDFVLHDDSNHANNDMTYILHVIVFYPEITKIQNGLILMVNIYYVYVKNQD